jgi:hypothetical protein
VTMFRRLIQESKCEEESNHGGFTVAFYSEWLVFKEVYSHHQMLFLRLDIENEEEKPINSILCTYPAFIRFKILTAVTMKNLFSGI